MKKLFAFIISFILITNLSCAFALEDCSAWATPDIERAIELDLIPIQIQGNYTNDISRSEFTHMAIRLMSALYNEDEGEIIKGADTSIFTDTKDSYIATAYALGIIQGIDNGFFAPDEKINRQEAAKILTNTYSVCRESVNTSDSEVYLYSDYADISDWAKPYVNTVTQWKVMQGTDNNSFAPHNSYTKEQAIVTFLRLYDYIKFKGGVMPSMDNKNPEITSMLKVENGSLTDGEKEVVLNGTNLGGWLLMETWMSPIKSTEFTAYSDIVSILNNRFGEYKAGQLLSAYEDNYITEKDFETIEALGFNCVRIPFWYRNFTDKNGNYLPNSNGNKRIDWALKQAEKHGLYVILDMHGCPGGQSLDHSTGVTGRNELYDNENNKKIMESVWTNIAKKYKDNKNIAAYDIMNEPQNNGGRSGKNAWQPGSREAVGRTNAIYERMVKAIRKVDSNHIITVEGIWSIDTLPDPSVYGWSNMMYQLHIYDDTKYMFDKRVNELTNAMETYGVATFVGEYNSKNFERYATTKYKENSISRAKWNYKTIGVWYDGWGLYNKNFDKVSISTSSYDELLKAFGEETRTENGFVLNIREYNMIK